MGDRTIQRLPFRLIAVLAAPFIFAGCGAPIAFQVASLFADGISLVTTDKTLTDHGLSAIAGKDCAVWRGIKGEEICLDETEESLVLAEAPPPQHPPNLGEDGDSSVFFGDERSVSQETKTDVTQTDWKAPETPGEQPVKAVPASPVITSKLLPPQPVTTKLAAIEPASAPEIPTATEIKGGIFYVIASFRGNAAAHRFSNKHAAWKTRVLEGTASGKTVFRVAIGPVGNRDTRISRDHLIKSGFKGAWAIKVSQPKVAIELAAMN
ncbi:MAG: hypothetical protein V3R37_04620 [Rhodospirillales bacterium]